MTKSAGGSLIDLASPAPQVHASSSLLGIPQKAVSLSIDDLLSIGADTLADIDFFRLDLTGRLPCSHTSPNLRVCYSIVGKC
jgi:hypothetical protein